MKVFFLAFVLLSIPCSAELCRRTGEKQCEPHSGKCLDAVMSAITGLANPRVINRLFKYGNYCGGAEKSCSGANNANAACKVRWDTSETTVGTTMLTPIALLVTTMFRPTISVSMKLEMLPDPKESAFQEGASVMPP
jgi:hypothetical protein